MISVALFAVLTSAVGRNPGDTTTACAADLAGLDAKIRQDYPGFVIEAVGPTRANYAATVASLSLRASRTPSDSCFPLLAQLTAFFRDPHLFVFQSTRLDSVEASRRASMVAVRQMDEDSVVRYLNARHGQLDPIEGIWRDRTLRLAIVAEPASQRRRFVAVVLTPDSSNWKCGDVRAQLTRRNDGTYAVDLSERNFALRHLNGTLHRGVLLRLSPGLWGKELPVSASEQGTIDQVDAHRPTLRQRDGAVVIAIPSHDPAYQAPFDSLIRANRDLLVSAHKLVVDLRGNEGGSSQMTASLLPFVLAPGTRPAGSLADAGILSSPDQITYALRVFIPDTTAPDNRRFLDRLRAHPGEVVPFFDSIDKPPPVPPDPAPAPGNRAVGFLIDHGTVSAAEAMVIDAARSPRVRVFGEESAGAIEYQNVSIVPFQTDERRWYLGYPTVVGNVHRTAAAPRHGIRPDERIDLAGSPDPVGEVIRRLKP